MTPDEVLAQILARAERLTQQHRCQTKRPRLDKGQGAKSQQRKSEEKEEEDLPPSYEEVQRREAKDESSSDEGPPSYCKVVATSAREDRDRRAFEITKRVLQERAQRVRRERQQERIEIVAPLPLSPRPQPLLQSARRRSPSNQRERAIIEERRRSAWQAKERGGEKEEEEEKKKEEEEREEETEEEEKKEEEEETEKKKEEEEEREEVASQDEEEEEAVGAGETDEDKEETVDETAAAALRHRVKNEAEGASHRVWNVDTFSCILEFLGPDDRWYFSGISRSARRAAQRCTDKDRQFGTVTLSPQQLEFVRALSQPSSGMDKSDVRVLQAPMAFGKTITAMATIVPDGIFDPQERVVVTGPSKVIDTWRIEFERVFPGCVDREVLVAHQSRKKQLARFLAGDPDCRVVLMSWACKSVGAALLWATRFVVDEAHTAHPKFMDLLYDTKRPCLLVSANRVAPHIRPSVVVGREETYLEAKARVPELQLRVKCIESVAHERRSFVAQELREGCIRARLDEYVDVILETVRKAAVKGGSKKKAPRRKTNVAIYLPGGAAGKLLEHRLVTALEAESWQVFKFVRAVSKLQRFQKASRSVVLIGHAHSESINVLASHLIIVRPDWVNVDRFAQIVGRTLRPTSPFDRVQAVCIVAHGVSRLRLAYYLARRHLTDIWPIEEDKQGKTKHAWPAARDLLAAEASLQEIDSSLVTASNAEVAAALDIRWHNPLICAAVFDLWLADSVKTITEEQMLELIALSVD